MSCINNQANINETFIIEPLFLTGDSITWSACTALYTNAVISCSGNTQIFMGTGVITFDGNMYTNDNLTANTINASTYLSGGTNLLDIFANSGIHLTGGTFNSNTDILSLFNSNGSVINVTGFTDFYTTGATVIGGTAYFNRNDKLSAYTLDLSSAVSTADTFVTGVTFANNKLVIARNDGINLSTFINNFTGLTVNGILSANTTYTNQINSLSGDSSIIMGTGEISITQTLTPANGNVDLGFNLKRFRAINTISGSSSYWNSTTMTVGSLTANTIDLGFDSGGDRRILTADSSVLKDDTLIPGFY